MPEKQGRSGDNGPQLGRPPELSDEDLDRIQRRLAGIDARRRSIDPRVVTIVMDGVERDRLDVTRKREWQIEVEAGTSLIEMRGEDERGDLLLATHLVSYMNNDFEFSRATATFANGKLKFGVIPLATQGDEPLRAVLSLNYQTNFKWTRPWTAWRDLRISGRTIRAYALAGLAIALFGWGVAGAFYARKAKLLQEQLQQAQRNQQLLPPTAARAIVSYSLVPDDQRVRGTGSEGIPEISLQLHSSAVALELPLPGTVETGSYSAELKTFAGDRTLMTQNFLRPIRTEAGWAVEIVLPADLLRPDSYYTAYLYSADRTDRFTFKAVNRN